MSLKVPSSRLSSRDVVAKKLRVPTQRGVVDVPTRVIEQGEVRLQAAG